MCKIFVFAGTADGRRLIDFLAKNDADVTAQVTTEYAETALFHIHGIVVNGEKLSPEAIEKALTQVRYDMVIDATHPYATSITGSIKKACEKTGTPRLRLLRGASTLSDDMTVVQSASEAAHLLKTTEGNILFTTGSKEIGAFSVIDDFEKRAYARVLPAEASLKACEEAGLDPAHIIAMQGPFSEEMNTAMLKAVGAKWLVTKDGGKEGGFEVKIKAAEAVGAKAIVIGRPPEEDGLGYNELIGTLCDKFGFKHMPDVAVLGTGIAASENALSLNARLLIEGADCIIGSPRLIRTFCPSNKPFFETVKAEETAEFIRQNPEYGSFVVLMSGDTGFFSGTKKLLPLLDFCEVNVIPGVSALSYFCSRLGISYEDIKTVSLHGRDRDPANDVLFEKKTFFLLGGEGGVKNLCSALTAAGLGSVRVTIGENLGSSAEKISAFSADSLRDEEFSALSVALVENDRPQAAGIGISDEDFIREEKIPMTKSEVRALCISKLRIDKWATCWDVGAGTGSVSVEMALQAEKGTVYAIEQKPQAIELLRKNAEKFHVSNIIPVFGTAPDCCADLPAPTHAFIGGSSGNAREIIAQLISKNPDVRIVAAAVTLESIADFSQCMTEFDFTETQVVSVNISRDKKLGSYHLMDSQNPIYIFTMQAGGDRI